MNGKDMKAGNSVGFQRISRAANSYLRRNLATGFVAGALVCLFSLGCRPETVDSQTVELRQRFLVATEPAGAMTLTEVASRLGLAKPKNDGQSDVAPPSDDAQVSVTDGDGDAIAEAEATEATLPIGSDEAIVVVGRIFAGDMEPWDPGKASFLLAELPDEGHGEGHDADNCPFCKRKAAKAPTAIVQFVDSAGNVITTDARKLLGVDKKDVVVVRGKVSAGELNTLLITATQMHVRGK